MNEDELFELNEIIIAWFEKKGHLPSMMLGFLGTSFVAMMKTLDPPDELANETFEKLYESYFKHPWKIKKEPK